MARHIVETEKFLKEIISELTSHARLAHDTETFGPLGIGGLNPFHGSRAFSHIFATKDDEFYVNFNNKLDWKHKQKLQPIFDDPNRIIYYVNAIFDGTISHFDGLKFNQRIIDCPSIARIDYNKHGKSKFDKESFLSMKYLAQYYKCQQKNDLVLEHIKSNDLYQKDYDGNYIKDIFKGKTIPEYQKVPIELMFEYGCDDARTTYDLGQKILNCINYKDKQYISDRDDDCPTMISVAQREVALTSVLLETKIKGVKHWEAYTKKAITKEEKDYKKLSTEVNKITGGINLNSGKQLAEFLTAKGVEVPRKDATEHAHKMRSNWLEKAKIAKEQGKDKHYHQAMDKAINYEKGNYITDKKTLKKLVEKNPKLDFLTKLTAAKEAEKKLNTYYRNFITLQDENYYIHADLNQNAAKTGRFSSSNPNLQNLEKYYVDLDDDDAFAVRKSFIADEGFRLFFVDYSQQEMIVMLDQAEEMPVIEKLKSGEYKDFYLAVKAILWALLSLDFSRYDIKQISLALAYGLGLLGLAKNLSLLPANANEEEENEAKRKVSDFKTKFFMALPKLKKFQKRLEREVKMYGKIHNAFGRVIYLDPEESYKALNAFVQSTSADITKASIIAVNNGLKEAGLESYFTICVHDENIFNIKIGEEEKAIPIIRKCMREAYPHKHIMLDVDFEYAPINKYGVSSWGEKQEWKS